MRTTVKRAESRKPSPGFTLAEVLVSSMLMSIIIVALMMTFASSTVVTQKTEEVTRAGFLGGQIRELLVVLPFNNPEAPPTWGPEEGESGEYPFDDLDDVAGKVFSPPILSNGTVLWDLTGWSQVVSMQSVSQTDFSQVVGNGSSPVVRVRIEVKHGDEVLATLSWLAFDVD